MSEKRNSALERIHNRPPVEPSKYHSKISELFASHVFTLEVMQEYLAEDIFKEVINSMEPGGVLERTLADKVANAMKLWALERGVTHYTHWFQPLTGLTAEKHDAFFDLNDGRPIESFSGNNLAQQEPDASSLPSGGIRNTFEARGYTAWDPSSPAFIFENRYGRTLCIPTIFVSYTGEALDYKAPLLKSIAALEKAALDVVHLFDRSIKKIFPTLGPEQEYFLIDRTWFDLRPDLMLTGRTIIGAPPARGQQLEDHYFGSIPERVYACMKEFETECYKLGIPLKTRHNEVAPSQFECAPIFEEQNVAVDHNALMMDVLDRVARKHNFRALLHEKPFAGINGSGKHNNWSLATDSGKNLLSPGKNPKDNLQFLTFFVCTIKAVYDYADLLRAAIASSGNDHRLGANEAPPAIISVFIGDQLTRILDDLEKPNRKKRTDTPKSYMRMGINKIPEILLDNTDRNRTSPFAFTGNKFEFRAVGSSENIAGPMTVLNSIVAMQLTEFKRTIDRKVTRGKKKDVAILEVIRDYIKKSTNIRFEGNGYGQEWVEEAKARGLSNIKSTPKALDAFVSPSTIELFENLGILSRKEVEARHEIRLERYVKELAIEAEIIQEMVINYVVPAAITYQNRLLSNIENQKNVGLAKKHYQVHLDLVARISELISDSGKEIDELNKLQDKADETQGIRAHAIVFSDEIVPVLANIRSVCDELESLLPDEVWPLPKYREMLFIR